MLACCGEAALYQQFQVKEETRVLVVRRCYKAICVVRGKQGDILEQQAPTFPVFIMPSHT